MEPPPKRLRLFGPEGSNESAAYERDDYTYAYDDEGSILDSEADDQQDCIVDDRIEDPDIELDQIRARLDNKLKSKFEAIFEKYGRDFTGIGDEIDLRTGEIVVDNGHLLEMEDERDAGISTNSILEVFTQEQQQTPGSVEVEAYETDSIDDSHIAPEDMEEDDMILFQTSDATGAGPKTPPPRAKIDSFVQQEKDIANISTLQHSYPSETQIMAQFGERLGPQIARYVSQQVPDNTNIEPAWQTPGLPLATPGKRPILKSILFDPGADRSPSPEGSSVWAPKMPPGRPRRDGADVAAVFRGETIVRDRKWYSSGYVSTTVTKKTTERADQTQSRRTMSVPLKGALESSHANIGFSKRKRPNSTSTKIPFRVPVSGSEAESLDGESLKYDSYLPHSDLENDYGPKESRGLHLEDTAILEHDSVAISMDVSRSKQKPVRKAPKVPFTQEDDEAVIAWVQDALRQGYALWSLTHWKILAERNPRHTYLSWAYRYRKHLLPRQLANSLEEKDFETPANEVPAGPLSARWIPSECGSGAENYASSDESVQEISESIFKGESSSHQSRRPKEEYSTSGRHGDRDVEDTEAIDPMLLGNLTSDGTMQELRIPYTDSGVQTLSHLDSRHNESLVKDENGVPIGRSPPRTYPRDDVHASSMAIFVKPHSPNAEEKISILCSVKNSSEKSPRKQELEQFSHRSFGPSYSFSDDEDDAGYEQKQPHTQKTDPIKKDKADMKAVEQSLLDMESVEEQTSVEMAVSDESHVLGAEFLPIKPPLMPGPVEKQPSLATDAGEERVSQPEDDGKQTPVRTDASKETHSPELSVVERQSSLNMKLSEDRVSSELEAPKEQLFMQEEHSQEQLPTQGEVFRDQLPSRADVLTQPTADLGALEAPSPVEIDNATEGPPIEINTAGEQRSIETEIPQEMLHIQREVLKDPRLTQIEVEEDLFSHRRVLLDEQLFAQRDSPQQHRPPSGTRILEDEDGCHTSTDVGMFGGSIQNDVLSDEILVDLPALKSPQNKDLLPPLPRVKSSPLMERSGRRGNSSPRNSGTPSSVRSNSSRLMISSILGSDDFEDLDRRPRRLATPALQAEAGHPGKESGHLISRRPDDAGRTSVPKILTVERKFQRRTITRQSKTGPSPSPSRSVFDIPGVPARRCGEEGYRCAKDFCFKCIGD